MTVNYSAFESVYGFRGTNFSVDVNGIITASSLVVDSIELGGTSLDLGNFVFSGSNINTNDDSEITFLTDSVAFSGNITALSGSITALSYTGSALINTEGEIELDSSDRIVIKNSPLQVFSITQDDRNLLVPKLGDIVYNTTTNDINYYAGTELLGKWRSLSTGDITFNGSTISAGLGQDISITTQSSGNINIIGNNLTITGSTVELVGTVTMGDLEITNTPTQNNHATRKDYVDARISAFAIAFGA